MTLAVTRDRTKDILAAIKEMTSKEVLIGIPAEGADRTPDPDDPAPLNNAQIGYAMEFGVLERNIPPRPHLLPGVESVLPKAIAVLKRAGNEALSGKPQEADKALHTVGLLGQNAVRGMITSGPFVPLSPVTLKRRKAKGRTGEKPLIDTGQYRRAHTYVVVKRGKR